MSLLYWYILSGSYIYADGTCIFYQYKDIHKIEDVLTKHFSTVCDCFVDKKLSIHFGKYKTKCNLFSETKLSSESNITYGNHNIKLCHTVEYLGSHLDSNLSGESMATKVFEKVNAKLKFLYRQNKYAKNKPKLVFF